LNDCWEWNGARSADGYGQKRIARTLYFTHRLAYEWANGRISNGLHVLHRCDNPPCCNPDHLYAGTNKDNIADSVRKGRRKRSYRPVPGLRAKRRPWSEERRKRQSKYSDGLKDLIRHDREGGLTFRAIAALRGVSYRTAYKVCVEC
jgi:hypothetical protein